MSAKTTSERGFTVGRAERIPLSIAPMMDRTDRYFRYFIRQLTKRTLLYTEMITMQAILHGDRELLLGFDDIEHPIVLQVGGDDPKKLAECARIAEGWGYDEININVGCPSDRVQNGNFGACLMARPERVAECVHAMRKVVSIPVSVKHRIGIDGLERYEDMANFVDVVSKADSDRFTVHARIAVLGGLSPKQNRTIPPLRYEEVYRLKREFPEQCIEINGGIRDFDATLAHLEHVDGVMIGRAAYEDPYLFSLADQVVFGDTSSTPLSRRETVEACFEYIERCVRDGVKLHRISRHMLPMFAGQPRGRRFRRYISEHAPRQGAGIEVLQGALQAVQRPAPESPQPDLVRAV